MTISIIWNSPRGPVKVTPDVVCAGLDYGFGDPFVIEVGAKVGPVWLNLDEVYEPRLGVVDVYRAVWRMYRTYRMERIWAPHDRPDLTQFLQSRNLPVLPCHIQNIDYGLSIIYGLLKAKVNHSLLGAGPRFRVNRSRCPGLVAEAGKYGYPDKKGEVHTTKPLDRDNHAWDAVRKYLTGEGEIPPDQQVLDLLDQPKMFVGADGLWRDNPRAAMAQMAMANADPDAALDEWGFTIDERFKFEDEAAVLE